MSSINDLKCKRCWRQDGFARNRRKQRARIQIRDGDMFAIVRIGVRCHLCVAGAGNKVQVGMRRNKK